MVRLNRIYTRTGDDGMTGLVAGPRRGKDDIRVEAFGTVDELNATIGLARIHVAAEDRDLDRLLGRIQNELFDLGADLATPGADPAAPHTPALRIIDAQVERLEADIDRLNAGLPALKSFVLPGGTPGSAWLHLARTVCRRAERAVVALSRSEPVGGPALRYLNRLSDLLFVACRHLNQRGNGDVLWVPGGTREP